MASLKPETLLRLRRLRAARRMFRDVPLFAFQELAITYPDYTYQQFIADVKPRPAGKSYRRPKNVEVKFGRYGRVQQLLTKWYQAHDYDALITAENLYKRLKKPYYVMVSIGRERITFTYPATVGISTIEALLKDYNRCTSIDQAIAIHERCWGQYGFCYIPNHSSHKITNYAKDSIIPVHRDIY